MANPQKENGHTDIANEIMEALSRTRIPGEARQVLDFIIRKTWGWNKKEDWISLSQFVNGTGLKKTTIIKARKKLLEMNLIGVTQKGNDGELKYRFNKDFESWKPLPKRVIVTQKGNSHDPKRKSALPKKLPTNKNTTNKNITNTKYTYMDYVKLTEKEYKKLVDIFEKERALEWIEDLNNYIGKKGEAYINKKYKSHYFMIMSWSREERKAIKAAKKRKKEEEKLLNNPESQEMMKKGEALIKGLVQSFEKKTGNHLDKYKRNISALLNEGIALPLIMRGINQNKDLSQKDKSQLIEFAKYETQAKK